MGKHLRTTSRRQSHALQFTPNQASMLCHQQQQQQRDGNHDVEAGSTVFQQVALSLRNDNKTLSKGITTHRSIDPDVFYPGELRMKETLRRGTMTAGRDLCKRPVPPAEQLMKRALHPPPPPKDEAIDKEYQKQEEMTKEDDASLDERERRDGRKQQWKRFASAIYSHLSIRTRSQVKRDFSSSSIQSQSPMETLSSSSSSTSSRSLFGMFRLSFASSAESSRQEDAAFEDNNKSTVTQTKWVFNLGDEDESCASKEELALPRLCRGASLGLSALELYPGYKALMPPQLRRSMSPGLLPLNKSFYGGHNDMLLTPPRLRRSVSPGLQSLNQSRRSLFP